MLSPTHEDNDQYDRLLTENPFADTQAAFIEPDAPSTSTNTTPQPQPQQQQSPSGSIKQQKQLNNTNENTTGNMYSGEDTLDEPVTVTISRDLKKVGNKLLQVLLPKGDRNVLRDWDLWGPLLLCLTLAIVLSIKAPDNQAVSIFTGVFVIVWLGAAVVTVNAWFLGGAVSFFQSVCVIGYCLFPIVVSAIVALFVGLIWVRLPIGIVSFAWSTYASVGFMSESQIHLQNRRALAVYPLVLFYFIISWLVLLS